MKIVMILFLIMLGCEVRETPCRSGVSTKNFYMGEPNYRCDYRAKSHKLSDGSVLCLCPEDVTRITQ